MAENVTLQQYERAERELAQQWAWQGFTIHATIYATVSLFLVLYNLILVPDFIWFYYPLRFWGVGLFAHYVSGVRQAGRVMAMRQTLIEQRARQIS
jgi:hypothetical protein